MSIESQKINQLFTERVDEILDKITTTDFLLHNHLETYDEFLDSLPAMIKGFEDKILCEAMDNEELIEYKLIVKSSRLGKVDLKELSTTTEDLLKLAINTNSSYTIDLFSTIGVKVVNFVNGIQKVVLKPVEILIGKIPLLVGSKYCPITKQEDWELKGYFVVNGSERHLINSEESANNIPLSRINEKTASAETRIISSNQTYRVINKVISENNVYEFIFRSNAICVNAVRFLLAHGVTIAELKSKVAQGDLSLEFELEKQIELLSLNKRNPINPNEFSAESLLNDLKAELSNSEDEKYKESKYNYIINNYILVHLGFEIEALPKKIEMCIQLLRRTMQVNLDQIKPDDTEVIVYRRIRSTGYLMKTLVSKLLYKLFSGLSVLHRHTMQPSFKLNSLIKSDILSNKLISAISTGNWSNNLEKMSTIVDRSSYILSLSGFRKVNSSLDRELQIKGTRNLRPSHRGRLCAVETPHSEAVGLVKSMCNGVLIANEHEPSVILEILTKAGLFKKSGKSLFIDGVCVGSTDWTVERIRNLRLSEKGLPFDCTITSDKNDIIISCDGGRILRPLLVCKNGELVISNFSHEEIRSASWQSLVRKEIIIFVDYAEEISYTVSELADGKWINCKGTSLVELCSSLILSMPGSLIPYVSHNAPAKLGVGVKLVKQAIGRFIPYNELDRCYTRTLISAVLKNPLVSSKYYYRFNLNKYGFGDNLVIAVSSYNGSNQADAIVLNKSSVSRGLFEIDSYRGHAVDVTKKTEGKVIGKRHASQALLNNSEDFSTIEDDGLPSVGQRIIGSKPVIGIYDKFVASSILSVDSSKLRDVSVYTKKNTKGQIKSCAIGLGRGSTMTANVILEENAKCEVGDKLSSRHGQKGIIAQIVEEHKLPYSVDSGLVPDLLCSPYCVAARMTMGHLKEIIAGKAACAVGRIIDATPFVTEQESVGDLLESVGFKKNGCEKLRNPNTGEIYDTEIFIGCAYYMRLCWLISDRLHARSKGAYQMLTLQPSEGRSRSGGLKVGEMQRDAMSAHGAPYLIQERFSSDSVIQQVNIQKKCLVDSNPINNYDAINKSLNIVNIKLPYVMRLIVNELRALHVSTKFHIGVE